MSTKKVENALVSLVLSSCLLLLVLQSSSEVEKFLSVLTSTSRRVVATAAEGEEDVGGGGESPPYPNVVVCHKSGFRSTDFILTRDKIHKSKQIHLWSKNVVTILREDLERSSFTAAETFANVSYHEGGFEGLLPGGEAPLTVETRDSLVLGRCFVIRINPAIR